MSIADSADVDPTARLGEGCAVWQLAQVRERAELGPGCIVGRGAYLGTGVRLGRDCKVQNHALVYEPAVLADGVFVGPAAVLTNDTHPRAITPEGRRKDAGDWEAVGVTVATGASIGARAVCVAPVRVGAWAMVAAGAVVVDDVADFALVAGTPARRIGWVGRAGVPLRPDPASAAGGADAAVWVCPRTGARYVESAGRLREDDGQRWSRWSP